MKRRLQWLRRRWPLLLVILGFAVLVVLQAENLALLGQTLIRGQWQWLLVAVLWQLVYYLFYAVQYEFGFATVEVRSYWIELVPVMFASIFLAALVPSGGVSSLAVFIDDAARRGQSPVRAAEGALLVLTADLATMAPLIFYGLSYLAVQGVLVPYQTIGVAAYTAFVIGLIGVILLGRLQPGVLRRVFGFVQENTNWLASLLKRSPVLPPDWAQKQASEYINAATHIADHPKALGWTLLIAFSIKFANLASLYAVSLAYSYPLAFGTTVAAFSLNVVFSVVALIPQGLGIAESIMALVLASLGVPPPTALTITLVFRGLNVWLPLFVGFLFLRYVRSFGARRRK